MNNNNIIRQSNWYEVNSEDCDRCRDACSCSCDCNRCRNKCYNRNSRDLAMSYVFKQQIHYARCVNGQKYNWVPLTNTDGTTFVHPSTNTQMSSLLMADLNFAQILEPAPNQYPDYSKVDVGKGIKWPKKVFSPFVDATAWPPFKFADLYATTKVPFYNLGFIVSQSPTICYPTWGTYYPAESGPLNDQIKALRALGGDVTVSWGGASNTPMHITAPDVNTLKEQYKRFLIAYGLTRLDLDLEGNWIDAAYNAQNMRNSQALKILQDELTALGHPVDVWFTLPILPTGLTADGLRILQFALDAGVIISGVNAMTMDYGDGPAPDPAGKMGQYGIQAITSLKDQLNTLYKGTKTQAELWAMVGITPMLGVNDMPDEIFKQTDAHQTLSFAQSNLIGMISMWSANRDNAAQTGIPQLPNEFSLLFNAYNM